MTAPTYPGAPARFVNPTDPEATAWLDTIRADLDTLRAAPADALTAVEARRDRVYAIEMNDQISPLAKGKQTDAATTEAMGRLDAILRGATDARDRITAAIDATEPERPTDAASALLAESRADRAWRRISAYLDTIGDDDSGSAVRYVTTLAASAASNGDRATLDALTEELDAYAARRRWQPLSDGSGFSQIVHTAAVPFQTPVRRHALRIAEAIGTGWPRIVSALERCRSEVTGEVGRTVMLPGFYSDEKVYSS